MLHTFNINKDINIEVKYFKDHWDNNVNSAFKLITIKGKLGNIHFKAPSELKVLCKNDKLTIELPENYWNKKKLNAKWNTLISMIRSSIKGVDVGHTLGLNINGVGYRAVIQDNNLYLTIGFSHPVIIPIPSYITQIDCPNANTIRASSYSLPYLSNFLNKLRLIRPSSADPYKSKGLSIINKFE